MDKVTLVTIHNAFERTGRDTQQVEQGITLEEIRAVYLPASVDFALSVNGRTVTDLETIPRHGDMVTAIPVVSGGGGGDDGKMIGRMIALVVLTVASYGIGAAFGATLGVAMGVSAGVGTAIISGAVMVAGGLLINAAFSGSPPNGGGLQTYGESAGSSPSYGWSPQSTQQQGTVIPRWYGKNKLYGNIIGAYVKNISGSSYINALIHLGFGPYLSISNFIVNDQPIANFTSIPVPSLRMGDLNQDVISEFSETVIEFNTSQLVTYAGPVTYTTQNSEYDRIDIGLQLPRGLGYYSDAGPLTAKTIQYDVKISPAGLNQWVSLGGVTSPAVQRITGLRVGRWVFMGNNRPRVWVNYHTVPTFTYKGQVNIYRLTSAGGAQMFYYTRVANDMPYVQLNGALPRTTADIYQVASPNYRNDVYDWEWYPAIDAQGYSLVWHYFSDAVNPYTDVPYMTSASAISGGFYVTGAQSAAMYLNHSFVVPSPGKYDILISRLSADFTTNRYVGELYLSTIKEVVGQKYTYPRQVLVGLKALATNQLSGALRFSCIAECAIVRVWDGTAWSYQYSTNPAWICYDILTQPVIPDDRESDPLRYDGIDPARVDHVKFKEWADYCNEVLPNGIVGQTEKRIEFNGGFDSEMSLWEAVLRITSVAYAVPHRVGNIYTVYIDKPADPVQLFSLGNIDQDSFKETFLPMEDRAAEIEVDFVNEENNYQRDKLSIVNTAIATVNSKVNLTLFGITKPSMAWRNAMRKLAFNQHISRTVDFGADIDAIACTVGDVILVQHDVPQWGYGGRVVSATTTAITVDQTITLEPATQYAILVRMADDSLVERDITNAPGDATVLTVSPAFTTAPAQFDVFTVGEILKTAKPFRVSNISRSSDLKAQISAVEYVAGVYNVDYDLPVTGSLDYTQSLTSYKQSLPPFESVTGLTVTESLRKYNSGQVEAVATIQWSPVVNRYAFPTVEVWAWQDGTNPQKISNNPITADSMEWAPPVDGVNWNFAVAVVNSNGETQQISTLVPFRIFVFGKTAPPADVTNFYATPVITGGIRFSWSPVADLDVLEYLIKYSPLTTGADWYGASELTRTAANYTNLSIAQTGTYFIKAVDTTGHESVNADNVVISTVASNIGLTPHTLIQEDPTWSGTKTALTLTGGELVATANSAAYTVGSALNFGSLKTARVTAKCDWRSETGGFDSIGDFDGILDLDNPSGKSNVQAYIYTSQTSAAPTFKQPLFAGDYTFWRASFSLEATKPSQDILTVHSLSINIDLHDTVITI